MDDLISRKAAIKLAIDLDCESRGIIKESKCREIENRYNMIPAVQPQVKCIAKITLNEDTNRKMLHFEIDGKKYILKVEEDHT